MDLEMTGLDPARNVIVEIATLVTDDDLNTIEVGPDLLLRIPGDVAVERAAALVQVLRVAS